MTLSKKWVRHLTETDPGVFVIVWKLELTPKLELSVYQMNFFGWGASLDIHTSMGLFEVQIRNDPPFRDSYDARRAAGAWLRKLAREL